MSSDPCQRCIYCEDYTFTYESMECEACKPLNWRSCTRCGMHFKNTDLQINLCYRCDAITSHPDFEEGKHQCEECGKFIDDVDDKGKFKYQCDNCKHLPGKFCEYCNEPYKLEENEDNGLCRECKDEVIPCLECGRLFRPRDNENDRCYACTYED